MSDTDMTKGMKYGDCRIGQRVFIAGKVEAMIDDLDPELRMIHTKPVPNGETNVHSRYGALATVAGWRQPWQLEPTEKP